MASPREALLAEAGRILAQIDQRQGTISVTIAREDIRLELAGAPPRPDVVVESPPEADTPAAPMAEWPSWWKVFSDTEERLLRVASLGDYRSAASLAERAGVPDSNDLMPILRNLAEKGMMESAPGRGFRLKAPPPGEQLPAFCGAGLDQPRNHEA